MLRIASIRPACAMQVTTAAAAAAVNNIVTACHRPADRRRCRCQQLPCTAVVIHKSAQLSCACILVSTHTLYGLLVQHRDALAVQQHLLVTASCQFICKRLGSRGDSPRCPWMIGIRKA